VPAASRVASWSFGTSRRSHRVRESDVASRPAPSRPRHDSRKCNRRDRPPCAKQSVQLDAVLSSFDHATIRHGVQEVVGSIPSSHHNKMPRGHPETGDPFFVLAQPTLRQRGLLAALYEQHKGSQKRASLSTPEKGI
jgi:hypothetical protein